MLPPLSGRPSVADRVNARTEARQHGGDQRCLTRMDAGARKFCSALGHRRVVRENLSDAVASLRDAKVRRVRTTINISEQLYREAKALAATTGRTVSEVIEDAVREALRPKAQSPEPIAPLPVFGGSGVLPGVDLAHRAAVIDDMDAGVHLDALR